MAEKQRAEEQERLAISLRDQALRLALNAESGAFETGLNLEQTKSEKLWLMAVGIFRQNQNLETPSNAEEFFYGQFDKLSQTTFSKPAWESAERPHVDGEPVVINNDMAFSYSADGKRMALEMVDPETKTPTILIWDREDFGEPLFEFDGVKGQAGRLVLSQDGTRLISTKLPEGGDGSVILTLFNLEGVEIRPINLTNDLRTVTAIAISPSNKYVAIAGSALKQPTKSQVYLWTMAETSFVARSFHTQISSIDAIAFLPNDSEFVFGGQSGLLRRWLVNEQDPDTKYRDLENTTGVGITSLSVSPSGQQLFVGRQDGVVYFWDIRNNRVRTAEEPGSISTGNVNPISSILFSADESRLIVGQQDGSLRIWEKGDGKFPDIHTQILLGNSAVRNGEYQLIESEDDQPSLMTMNAVQGENEVTWRPRVWHLGQRNQVGVTGVRPLNGSFLNTLRRQGVPFATFVDGNQIQFNPLQDSILDIPDPINLEASSDAEIIQVSQVSPDGELVVVVLLDGTTKSLQIWDVNGSIDTPELTGDLDIKAVFGNNSEWLALSDSENLIIWSRDGETVLEPPEGREGAVASSMLFSKDDAYLAVIFSDEQGDWLSVWNSGSWDAPTLAEELDKPDGGRIGEVSALAFTPSGSHVAAASSQLHLFDLANRFEDKLVIPADASAVEFMVFRQQAEDQNQLQLLTAGSQVGTVDLWTIDAGQVPDAPNYQAAPHTNQMVGLEIVENGERFATVDANGMVRKFPFLDTQLKAACEHVPRNFSLGEWVDLFETKPYSKTCANRPVHESLCDLSADEWPEDHAAERPDVCG